LPEKLQVSECATNHKHGPYHRITERSTSGSLGNVSWVQKADLQLYRKIVPLLRMSTQHPGISLHVNSFTRPSPA